MKYIKAKGNFGNMLGAKIYTGHVYKIKKEDDVKIYFVNDMGIKLSVWKYASEETFQKATKEEYLLFKLGE